ncbi:MAG: SPOR domain-containing protein [Methylomicrobium sp.]
MTESVNKKSKEGRYRVESNIAEIDPVIEPLTDLDDDEDAIDRLLINTGFDAEEEVSAYPQAWDKTLSVHQDPLPQLDAFSEDKELAALQSNDDEYIEPVDIGSPIADVELAPAPHEAAFASDDSFIERNDSAPHDSPGYSAFHDPAAKFTAAIQDAFASHHDTSEAIERVDFEPPVPDVDGLPRTSYSDRASSENYDELFEHEPDPISFPQSHVAGEASATAHAKFSDQSPDDTLPQVDIPWPENDMALDAPAPPYDWNRLFSMQEDARQQMAQLRTRTRNARRLSYAAIALSLAALGGVLAVGYLNAQTRAELTKLKDMQSIMEEDMSGLNEKLGSDDQAAEDSAEKLRHLSAESAANPEDKPIPVDSPSPPATASIQAKATAPTVTAPKPIAPSVRKSQPLPTKPAMNKALPKPSAVYPAKPAAIETEGHWSVNLAAFRQIEDARKKAAEFRQKGVSVKVTKVDIKRSTWYRLSVPGFKTKEAASTYSYRLKKLLRLNSIWVAAI